MSTLKLCGSSHKQLRATQRIVLGSAELTILKAFLQEREPCLVGFKPSSSWVGEELKGETQGSKEGHMASPMQGVSRSAGRRATLLIPSPQWAWRPASSAGNTSYICGAGRGKSSPSVDGTAKALTKIAQFSRSLSCARPKATHSWLRFWTLHVWTETSRDWKERPKLTRGAHQPNQTCTHLPVLACTLPPDQQPRR